MKILHVITSLLTGGAEKLMVDLLPRLSAEGHQVDLCLFNGTDTPFKQLLAHTDVRIYSFGTGSVYNPLHILRLARLIRRERYDIVHTHNTAPQLFGALASMLCSVVLCTTEHTTSNRRRGSKWYVLIDRWMYSRYQKVICISDKTESALRESLNGFPIPALTIYNGIDVAKIHSAKSANFDKQALKCSIALVQVAGFRYQKDQKTVVKALLRLPESVHVFFIGDGIQKNEVVEMAHSLGVEHRTHFMGIRSDVPAILKAADIVVMSSHYEGFGLAAVEGMAASKPVIASDVDGLREVVAGAGITFTPGDANDLADKIKSLINDYVLYQATAEKCFKRAQQFDISQMTNGYLSVYKELLTP